MNNSTFSAIRIVAIMIGTDRKIHHSEIRWFLRLMGHYGVTKEQRKILREDIENQPDIENIFECITDPVDREQLLIWLRKVISEDGDVNPAEKALFNRVERLTNSDDQQELIKELLAHDKNMQMWKALNAAGKMARSHVSPWGMSRAFATADWDMIGSHRGVFWGVILFFLLLFLIRGCTGPHFPHAFR